jgi:sulfur transfer complex TusBCD TusB component (DsrH family)
MGAFESGQAFIAGVLAKLPEEQRAQAKAIFDAAEAKDAVTLLGDGTLARADYSKSMDSLRDKEGALNEHYERLNNWYTVNKDALEEAKALKERGPAPPADPLPPSDKPPIQSAALSAEDVRRLADEAVNSAGRDYIAVSAFIASQGLRHLHMFGEPLDALELVQNPKVGRPIAGQPGRIYSLQDAYLEKYGERIATRQKEAEDKRINDEVEKRLVERTKQQSTHPFPLRNESSPLDVLQSKEGPAAHTLDSAVAEYERLQAARGS